MSRPLISAFPAAASARLLALARFAGTPPTPPAVTIIVDSDPNFQKTLTTGLTARGLVAIFQSLKITHDALEPRQSRLAPALGWQLTLVFDPAALATHPPLLVIEEVLTHFHGWRWSPEARQSVDTFATSDAADKLPVADSGRDAWALQFISFFY